VAGAAREVPDLAAKVIGTLAEQASEVQDRIRQLERDLLAWYRASELARRIATVPGVGLLGATALAATVTDPTHFRSGRQFAAWLGLTPLNNSSGGKERLGRISKMGDQYLRRLLVTGMTSLVRRNKHHPSAADPRMNALLARKPVRVVTVAMANRAARAIWAIMVRGEVYRVPVASVAAA
jgi:transposase